MDTKVKKETNRWVVIAVLTLAFSLTFINRYVWSSIKEEVALQWGLNAVQQGMIMSTFFAGYLIATIPSGILADHFHPKYMLIFCVFAGGASTALFGAVNDFASANVLRVITGFAGGCILGFCSRIVFSQFRGKQLAAGMGIIMASPAIGSLLVNIFAPLVNAAVGWRITCYVCGMVSLIDIILIFIFVKSPRKDKGEGQIQKSGQSLTVREIFSGLIDFVKNPHQILAALVGCLCVMTQAGFLTWAHGYLQTLGYSPAKATPIVLSFSIVGIISCFLSGGLGSRLKVSHRKIALTVAIFILACSAMSFGFVKSYGLLVTAAVFTGFLVFLPPAHISAFVMQTAGEKSAATAISAFNLILNFGGIAQPVMIGAILDNTQNYKYVWLAVGAFSALAFICMLFIKFDESKLD